MNNFENRPYLYGQLNKFVEQVEYNFISTDTVSFIVEDNSVRANINNIYLDNLIKNTIDKNYLNIKALSITLPDYESLESTTPIGHKTFKCVNGQLVAID